MSQELKITKERVLKAAEKCSTAKDTLKELFPEAFEAEAHYFGREFTCGTYYWDNPFMIGDGIAPDGLKGRCLIVSLEYDLEVIERGDTKILVFRKKP